MRVRSIGGKLQNPSFNSAIIVSFILILEDRIIGYNLFCGDAAYHVVIATNHYILVS